LARDRVVHVPLTGEVDTHTLGQLGAAAIVLSFVTACDSKNEERAVAQAGDTSASALTPSNEEPVVNVYNCADYIDPVVLEKFTAETGIRVN
jgi:spermidine/putrescine-binding protein